VFNIEFDITPLAKQVDQMLGNLAEFPPQMAAELTAWQTEDMHRKYPNTTLEGNTATTDIWPRSRGVLGRITRAVPLRLRRRFTRRITTAQAVAASLRPILRTTLADKLLARMAALMQKELKWQ
jgi:hypothetical protein